MKKKLSANLLVGSAVIGASLAPLSAQVMTTGNTPMQTEFGGGVLPDEDGITNIIRSSPDAASNNFDLLYVPVSISSDKIAISSDLSFIKSSSYTNYGISDLRGTKEDWHVTATILKMTDGEDKSTGVVSFSQIGYILYYDEVDNSFRALGTSSNSPVAPELPATGGITIGSGATSVGNAVSGEGQGLWNSHMVSQRSNIITPYQQLKAGVYIDNITQNLVAGLLI